jgi:hypothetical protein
MRGSAEEALLLFVPVASDAAASSVAVGLRQKAAIGAVENDGGYNGSAVNQRADAPNAGRLTDLYVRITNALPDMPEGSANRQIALINLRNIRSVLARHDLTP